MGKKRNHLGQYIKEDGLVIKIPGFQKLLQYALVLIILSPWIYVVFFRIDLKDILQNIMNYLFKIDGKSTSKNGYF